MSVCREEGSKTAHLTYMYQQDATPSRDTGLEGTESCPIHAPLQADARSNVCLGIVKGSVAILQFKIIVLFIKRTHTYTHTQSLDEKNTEGRYTE